MEKLFLITTNTAESSAKNLDAIEIERNTINFRKEIYFIITHTGELIACDTYSDYLVILDEIHDRDIYN